MPSNSSLDEEDASSYVDEDATCTEDDDDDDDDDFEFKELEKEIYGRMGGPPPAFLAAMEKKSASVNETKEKKKPDKLPKQKDKAQIALNDAAVVKNNVRIPVSAGTGPAPTAQLDEKMTTIDTNMVPKNLSVIADTNPPSSDIAGPCGNTSIVHTTDTQPPNEAIACDSKKIVVPTADAPGC